MNDATLKMIDLLNRVVSENGNPLAANLMLRIVTADDPDEEAAKVYESLRAAANRLVEWARAHPEVIEAFNERKRQAEARDNN